MVWIFHIYERFLPCMFKFLIDLFNAFGCAFLHKMAQIVLCVFIPMIYWYFTSVRTLALCQNHRFVRIAG